MWNIEELAADVEALERKFENEPTGQVVFYGSSSIRLWPFLKRDFPNAHPQNLGFGGSTLIGCAHYFERLVVPRKPRALVIFAGDNDIAMGATPEMVWQALHDILEQRNQMLGLVPLVFIALKPSPSRASMFPAIRETNEWCRREIESAEAARWVDIHPLMLLPDGEPNKTLFVADGVHLSRAGYEVWVNALRAEAGDLLD